MLFKLAGRNLYFIHCPISECMWPSSGKCGLYVKLSSGSECAQLFGNFPIPLHADMRKTTQVKFVFMWVYEICKRYSEIILTLWRLTTYIYIYIYICHTVTLTSRRCVLNIYSTNILTEYFKHTAHSPFFQDALYFIMLSFFVLVIFTFQIQG